MKSQGGTAEKMETTAIFLFHYHEDGSKKLNACNQFFFCMVYF
jgi:hypothetical protein